MKNNMSPRELKNAQLSQEIAEAGMVLLQNKNHVLPLQDKKIALYGSGAFETYKGGTGSGDVNQRQVINIQTGLEDNGFEIVTKGWLNRFEKAYQKKKSEYYHSFAGSPLAVLAPAFSMDDPQISEFAPATTGVYVISRSSGEGQDRKNEAGDYLLTENEQSNLQAMSQFYEHSAVLLNVGGVIDTSFIDQNPTLDSVLLISQPGMQAGNAVAEILSGNSTPSGKLTDTWAYNYSDYYSANSFGQKDPHYQEGIYVGYRYFDSFNVSPRFEFGYGLSYTDFSITTSDVQIDETAINVKIKVANTGSKFRGSEVVQMYVSNPQTNIPTPYQSLQAYQKTDVLKPGESQDITLSVPLKNLASFDEKTASFVLPAGIYRVRIGNSSKLTEIVAEFKLNESVSTEQLEHKLLPDQDPAILKGNNVKFRNGKEVSFFVLRASKFDQPVTHKYHDKNSVTTYLAEDLVLPGKDLKQQISYVNKVENPKLVDVYNQEISLDEFVAEMSDNEMIDLVEGVLRPEQLGSIVGNGADLVPGAAGQTVNNLQFGIPATVNADGPAGLRLTEQYQDEQGKIYHQYATAWPIGTMLAQTWDTELIKKLGQAVGQEMKEFGVTMWLAPGMNIHRDPLGGRNFEYFSEDPLLSGTISAAEVNGVQQNPGVGAVIKHFLGNNQETLRNTGDSIIGEQALREIYLKNFEIVIKSAQPMAVMSSYNKVNGVFSGENFDSLTNILRDEWHFKGLVMTDWYSLADPVSGLHAGNDLVMPGCSQDQLTAAISDLAPEFNQNGLIKTRKTFDIAEMSEETIQLWNDFVPDPKGSEVIKIKIQDSDEVDDEIKQLIFSGTGQVIDDTNVVISGHWKDNNRLYIGDLQKSVKNILTVIMKTDRFFQMIGEAAKPLNSETPLETYFDAKVE